jgi:hypothetical protein
MALTKYTYSISGDFPYAKMDSDRLVQEIEYSAIVTVLRRINTEDDVCDIWFADALSQDDETILDGLVNVHCGDPLASGDGDITEELVYTDTANKVIGPLGGRPNNSECLKLDIIGGLTQDADVDYTVRDVINSTVAGSYVCISPDSTPPGGGSFNGGSNPSVGIEDQLENGTTVRIVVLN